MAVKFFGQFLIERGFVSREMLVKAIELQESVNLSFGQIAIAKGYMTDDDVIRVNQAQRREDQRFGDLAAKWGLIKEEQLQEILAEMKATHLFLGEALVKVGGLCEEDLPRYLMEFKEEQAGYDTDQVTIPEGVPHAEIFCMMADMTYKMLIRIARLTFRQQPCRATTGPASNDIGAAMRFTGDISGRYTFTVSRDLQLKIASAMLGEPDAGNESPEVLNDTIMEFINVVCGNVAAKGAQSGVTIEIQPPELLENPDRLERAPGETALSFPMVFPDSGRAELVLFINK